MDSMISGGVHAVLSLLLAEVVSFATEKHVGGIQTHRKIQTIISAGYYYSSYQTR